MLSLSSSKNVSTSFNSKNNLSRAQPQPKTVTSAKTHIESTKMSNNKEMRRLESSAENLDNNNQCPVDNLCRLNKEESILSAAPTIKTKCNLQLKFAETDLFAKVPVNTHFVQSGFRQSQRVKSSTKKEMVLNADAETKASDLNRPENGISLEERLRKKKIFRSDDYAFINYYGTPNVKTSVKSIENEMLLNNAENSESDVESLSPTSLNNQNARVVNSGKYFTISSNAGHRFRKIIKKYV